MDSAFRLGSNSSCLFEDVEHLCFVKAFGILTEELNCLEGTVPWHELVILSGL